MKTVCNKTSRPLRITLHEGHILHLGPHKTAQVADHDAVRPSFQRMLERGEIALVESAGMVGPPPATRVEAEAHGEGPHRPVVAPIGGRTASGRHGN